MKTNLHRTGAGLRQLVRAVYLLLTASAGRVANLAHMAARRLISQRGLAAVAGSGLLVAAALTLSIPAYADATHFRLLRERLNGGAGAPDEAPLPFLLQYTGERHDGPQWEDLQAVDRYFLNRASAEIGLAPLQIVRRFRTDNFKLFPPLDPDDPTTRFFITYASLGLLTGRQPAIELVDGVLPGPAPQEGPLPVAASLALVEEFGLQTGDTYYLRRDEGTELPVQISGIWQPVDEFALYWDNKSSPMLLVDEETYAGRVAGSLQDEVLESLWFLVLDGSPLHSSDVAGLLDRLQGAFNRAISLRDGLVLKSAPLKELERYDEDAPALTFLLYAFSIPILGLVLVFMGLVASLYINEKRNEIAILRSRGSSALQVAGATAIEGALLGVLALLLAAPLGEAIAYAIGRSRSFLNFSAPPSLRISLTGQMLLFGILAIAVIVLVQFILPALSAARHTIVTYKQERARQAAAPAWQRYYLDLLLLVPAGYGYFLLQRQAGLAAEGSSKVPDPLRNPLLLLVPALGIFALSLLTLRLVPRVMATIAWALARTRSVGMVMASRYLSRTPAFFSAPLILLVLTLSLSAFTASLAYTLDRHLTRQMSYSVGADLSLLEQGAGTPQPDGSVIWTFGPVEEHLIIPGVQAATRVGRYPTGVRSLSGQQVRGVFIGIDRQTFPQVAYWQRSFARQPLVSLMNEMAAAPNGVLVSREFMDEEGLQVGDPLNLTVNAGNVATPVELVIVGILDLFPTWYPQNGPLFVGSLDELYTIFGDELPHHVWLKLAPGIDPERVTYAVRGFSIVLDQKADRSKLVEDGLNIQVTDWAATSRLIAAEQVRPERQGLFGLLSVGFIISALLTVLGFLVYAAFSFRRRFVELGMLRAIGLSTRQMIGLLAAELVFLILTGLVVGTLLGVSISYSFVPYLQMGTPQAAHYPPFQVEIAWPAIFQVYILFGVLFLGGLAALAALLLRMKIFQAVKLGETI